MPVLFRGSARCLEVKIRLNDQRRTLVASPSATGPPVQAVVGSTPPAIAVQLQQYRYAPRSTRFIIHVIIFDNLTFTR